MGREKCEWKNQIQEKGCVKRRSTDCFFCSTGKSEDNLLTNFDSFGPSRKSVSLYEPHKEWVRRFHLHRLVFFFFVFCLLRSRERKKDHCCPVKWGLSKREEERQVGWLSLCLHYITYCIQFMFKLLRFFSSVMVSDDGQHKLIDVYHGWVWKMLARRSLSNQVHHHQKQVVFVPVSRVKTRL